MSSTPHPFRHPIHSRGIQARRYDTAITGPLTDKAIFQYRLDGHYGPAEQEKAKAELETKARLVQKMNNTRQQKQKKDSILQDSIAALLEDL